jgi:hypothetical protein
MTKYSEAFINEHRDFNVNHEWWDSTYDDFERICEILGIELGTYPVKLMNCNTRHDPDVRFSGFCSQGDGASWAGKYRAQSGFSPVEPTYDLAPAKIREYCNDEELHHIADELCMLARIYGPVYAKVSHNSSNYCHSQTMELDWWEYYDEEIDMDDIDGDILNHIETTLIDLFRDLADWLYKTLENEYDYLTSDEAVIESLEANEIEEDEEA